jgi:hypothetical protein
VSIEVIGGRARRSQSSPPAAEDRENAVHDLAMIAPRLVRVPEYHNIVTWDLRPLGLIGRPLSRLVLVAEPTPAKSPTSGRPEISTCLFHEARLSVVERI